MTLIFLSWPTSCSCLSDPFFAGFIGRACNCPPGFVGSGEGVNGCTPQGHRAGPCSNDPCVHGSCKVSIIKEILEIMKDYYLCILPFQ